MENQPERPNPDQGRESIGWVILRFCVIYFAMSNIMTFFRSPPASDAPSKSSVLYTNLLSENDQIDFSLYLSQDSTQELIWSASDLNYNYDETNILERSIQVPVTPYMLNNGTVFLIGEFNLHSSSKNQKFLLRTQKQLTKYTDRVEKNTVNLLSGEKKEIISDKAPHWIPLIDIFVVLDQNPYSTFPPQMANKIKLTGINFYPMIDLSDFWVTRDRLVVLNDTLETVPLNLTFTIQSFYKSLFYMQFEQSQTVGQAYGLHSEGEFDIMKKMFLETNVYLLVTTMIVSFIHMIFEFVAYKKEVQFWYGRENLTGLSVNLLIYNFVQTIVVFLYLLDSEKTSFAVWLPLGIGVAVEGWKVTKGFDIKFQRQFKFLDIKVKEAHKVSATSAFDNKATKFLGYLLIPVAFFYGVYGLYAYEYKSWYSWVVGTLASMIYTCGFVMMTPQLYINYKLKSVAHMPWDVLTYRALNTFIDDMFAFIISMPTMHRLACFRDDIIFFVFLYQKWAYRVDYNRHYLDSGDSSVQPIEENKEVAVGDKKND